MPIHGGTLGEAAAQFRDHLNRVLAQSITPAPLVLVAVGGLPRARVQLAFRQGGQATEVRLRSRRFGVLWLWLGQICESTVQNGQHRLRTVAYRYTLRVDGAREPLFRWEYEKELPPPGRHCRHHIQGIPLTIGRAKLSLDTLHVPTGFVTIEEIVRFCVVDLKVSALSTKWDEVLRKSYEKFKTKFAPRGEV